MEGKKSVLLYCDLIHTIEKMDDETAGIFFKHYLRYINDLDPKTDNLVVELTFESVKQNLKRDLKKWVKTKEKYSKAGVISAKSKRLQKGKQLYILKVQNDLESFIKVGITDNSVSRRFSSKETFRGTDYKFEIVKQVFIDNPIDLENLIGKKFSKNIYHPRQKFEGHTECYELNSLNDIIQCSTKFNDVKQRSTNPSVNVNDNVNVNVNVNDNVIEKKNNKKNRVVSREIVYPFNSEKFLKYWEFWKEYKHKEFKFKYKSDISEQSALKKLSELADGSEEDAIKIIENSISNSWKGFFKLNENEKRNSEKNQSVSEYVNDFFNKKR